MRWVTPFGARAPSVCGPRISRVGRRRRWRARARRGQCRQAAALAPWVWAQRRSGGRTGSRAIARARCPGESRHGDPVLAEVLSVDAADPLYLARQICGRENRSTRSSQRERVDRLRCGPDPLHPGQPFQGLSQVRPEHGQAQVGRFGAGEERGKRGPAFAALRRPSPSRPRQSARSAAQSPDNRSACGRT
jgi:hypothetical protein